MVRIAVADDHPLLREGVVRTLEEDPEIEVTGQAGDADGAVRLVAETAPDVLLLDLSMPGGGLTALARVMAMAAPPKVAILTVSEEDDNVLAALKAGAAGYILKGVGSRELVEIVKNLVAGQSYLSPTLAMKVLHQMQKPSAPRRADDPLSDLSKREEDILRLVARGLSNREVGAALDLQEKTVKHYMTSILQKLQVRNRVEAVLAARGRWTD